MARKKEKMIIIEFSLVGKAPLQQPQTSQSTSFRKSLFHSFLHKDFFHLFIPTCIGTGQVSGYCLRSY